MPTTMLTLAWLFVATTQFAASPSLAVSVAGSSLASSLDATALQPAPLSLVGPLAGDEPDEAGWLLFESDNDEETDDTKEFGIGSPSMSWPKARSPFGVVVSNPHPTILPRSALRSPVLRC